MLARSIVTKAATASVRAIRPVARASHTLKDREAAVEKAWVNEEDEKLLRKLSAKLREQQKVEAPKAARAKEDKEREALLAIVGKFKASDADIKSLIAWRHSHEF